MVYTSLYIFYHLFMVGDSLFLFYPHYLHLVHIISYMLVCIIPAPLLLNVPRRLKLDSVPNLCIWWCCHLNFSIVAIEKLWQLKSNNRRPAYPKMRFYPLRTKLNWLWGHEIRNRLLNSKILVCFIKALIWSAGEVFKFNFW